MNFSKLNISSRLMKAVALSLGVVFMNVNTFGGKRFFTSLMPGNAASTGFNTEGRSLRVFLAPVQASTNLLPCCSFIKDNNNRLTPKDSLGAGKRRCVCSTRHRPFGTPSTDRKTRARSPFGNLSGPTRRTRLS